MNPSSLLWAILFAQYLLSLTPLTQASAQPNTVNQQQIGLDGRDVVAIARSFESGGLYDQERYVGYGVPRPVVFKDKKGDEVTFEAKTNGATYCSGFTFAVAMETAKGRGLLKTNTTSEIRTFQQIWYGNRVYAPSVAQREDYTERQCVAAICFMGIGTSVNLTNAQPGDFIQFYRCSEPAHFDGHSVVFLEWLTDGTPPTPIGFKYRSSQRMPFHETGQSPLEGIGDSRVYFQGIAKTREARYPFLAVTNRTYVGRLFHLPSAPTNLRIISAQNEAETVLPTAPKFSPQKVLAIKNVGAKEANLKGYTLTDSSGLSVTLNSMTVLLPEQCKQIKHEGRSIAVRASREWIFLRDSQGILLDRVTYGSLEGMPPEHP